MYIWTHASTPGTTAQQRTCKEPLQTKEALHVSRSTQSNHISSSARNKRPIEFTNGHLQLECLRGRWLVRNWKDKETAQHSWIAPVENFLSALIRPPGQGHTYTQTQTQRHTHTYTHSHRDTFQRRYIYIYIYTYAYYIYGNGTSRLLGEHRVVGWSAAKFRFHWHLFVWWFYLRIRARINELWTRS